MPMAAVTHMEAAVVRPRTSSPWRRMLPAPRNPTPVTICAAMRVGSTRVPKAGTRPIAVNSPAPAPMSAIVRMPAGFVLGLGLVRELGQVKAVDEVAEHREAFVVDRGLRLVLLVAGFVGLGDDARGLHDLGGDEDGAFHAHCERDGV